MDIDGCLVKNFFTRNQKSSTFSIAWVAALNILFQNIVEMSKVTKNLLP
jgi:hypothetical protein